MLTHVDLKTNKETTANVWFAYQGPSPNDRPASVNPADEVDEDDAEPEAGVRRTEQGQTNETLA